MVFQRPPGLRGSKERLLHRVEPGVRAVQLRASRSLSVLASGSVPQDVERNIRITHLVRGNSHERTRSRPA